MRKETTKLLTDILISDRLTDRKYYATEVTLDYGTNHSTRVDVMQFLPKGVTFASEIEKGIFICYEIKSCMDDIYSGHGLNFYGEKNYLVMNMETYNQWLPTYQNGYFGRYLKQNYPNSSYYYGVLVAVPKTIDIQNKSAIQKEIMCPTQFNGKATDWRLYTPIQCREGHRIRPMNELLFCMLRSKHNYTNNR